MLSLTLKSERRSPDGVIRSTRDVKSWVDELPSVSAVRPRTCPSCGAAGHPEGSGPVVQGHGPRERTVRGPGSGDSPPVVLVILVRRYLCKACNTACTVVPRGIAPGYQYAGFAIAMAAQRQ